MMSKEARKTAVLTVEARQKLADAAEALAACGFGPDGSPLETTFAEIEGFGHAVGRMLAQEVDKFLTSQHAAHFLKQAECPCCGAACDANDELRPRRLQTVDGDISLHEPIFHCLACRRDFFPSMHTTED